MKKTNEIGNLKELEEKINSLERTNFDLKMQLFYLNENKSKRSNIKDESLSGSTLYNNGEEDDNDTESVIVLQAENISLNRRVKELESELLQIKLTRERETEKYLRAMKAKPLSNSLLIEENHKRERQAAIAIAEHDAAMISKLQLEIDKYQKQHESNISLITDLSEKLSNQTELTRQKNLEMVELTQSHSKLQQDYNSLSEKFNIEEAERKSIALRHNNKSIATLENDLDILKNENSMIKEQMDRLKEINRGQEESLNQLSESGAEMNRQIILSNQSTITRLESEVVKYKTDKEVLIQNYQKMEVESEITRQKLQEYERRDTTTALGSSEIEMYRSIIGIISIVLVIIINY